MIREKYESQRLIRHYGFNLPGRLLETMACRFIGKDRLPLICYHGEEISPARKEYSSVIRHIAIKCDSLAFANGGQCPPYYGVRTY